MKIIVTGSAGHLGEGLCRTLISSGNDVTGMDILPSPFTSRQGSITDFTFVRDCLAGADAVIHVASLHKPHVATHSYQDFIDTNITGTLNLLRAAVDRSVERFIFTSTTSVFGNALVPEEGLPAAWITEEVIPVPKNIYGITKAAAEDLCQLFHHNHGINCLILRTSRFFPEEDDNRAMRLAYNDDNLKANEYLFRRVDLADAVDAHVRGLEKVNALGFGKYIVSATSPFTKGDLRELRVDAPPVVAKYLPDYEGEYARRNWKMFPKIDRVYVNEKARMDLGWEPTYDFSFILSQLKAGRELRSDLAMQVGSKGYHTEKFTGGPYPVS